MLLYTNTLKMKKGYTMIDKNFEWYQENYQDLYKKYPEKFLIIANEKVEGAFDTLDDAYVFGVKEIWLGNFLLQKCEDALKTLNFHGLYQIK